MPLNTKIGGPVEYVKDKETIFLTNDQARHIYKEVELEGIVNIDTITQEIEEDKLGKCYLAVAYIVTIICIYYYTPAYNTPETQSYDCVSCDIRSNPK